tara:strand:+ start:650 stop:946 length:297 start_codon:yes stop_codon:yes gene_type:complete
MSKKLRGTIMFDLEVDGNFALLAKLEQKIEDAADVLLKQLQETSKGVSVTAYQGLTGRRESAGYKKMIAQSGLQRFNEAGFLPQDEELEGPKLIKSKP